MINGKNSLGHNDSNLNFMQIIIFSSKMEFFVIIMLSFFFKHQVLNIFLKTLLNLQGDHPEFWAVMCWH